MRTGSLGRRCWLWIVSLQLSATFRGTNSFSVSCHSKRRRSLSSSSSCITAASSIDEQQSASTITTTDSTAAITTTDRILELVRQEHITEVTNGFQVWGKSGEIVKQNSTVEKQWTDKDFVSRSVGVGNAGPDEFVLENGHKVFQTVEPVLTVDECNDLISEAREAIDKGLEQDGVFHQEQGEGRQQHQPSNSQLGEARLSQMPRARRWLRNALHERFFPLLQSRFGIPSNELTLNDALIIGYGYFGGASRSQPVHRDSDILSLNVALSPRDAFDQHGGGTFFEGLPLTEEESSVIQTNQGHVLCHSGGAQHAGRGISQGERWILVLFCVAKNEPQLARRCHARGLIERQEGKLDDAEATFHAGLSVAPHDHLLLSSLGGVLMAKGDKLTARSYLCAAALSYKHCQKANLGLGRMMLADGRPRAALRRFDTVLDYFDDLDLKQHAWMPLKAMGWDARVYGSHAAILCAQKAMKAGFDNFDSSACLCLAIDRLEFALSAAPDDNRILSMLSHAQDLLLD